MYVPKVKKVREGTETFSHIGPKIRKSLLGYMRESDIFYSF